MHDVAREAGVSLKTVSRVVNAEDGVRRELVERVEAAVRSLNYQPDDRARWLRSSSTSPTTIGFIVEDLANPFFSAVLRGLEDVARRHGCLVLTGSSDGDPDRQEQLIEAFIRRRIGGLLVALCTDGLTADSRAAIAGTPLVFVDREPADQGSFDVVRSDDEAAAYAITAHVIAHGHRRIGFLGEPPSLDTSARRISGFSRALADHGLASRPEWFCSGHFTPGEWESVVTGWLTGLDEQPTAIVSAMNYSTSGTVRALHRLGLQHDIALIGIDDIEFGDLVSPAISVWPQQPRELGVHAGRLIFERIARPGGEAQRIVLSGSIVARGSGELTAAVPTGGR